MGWGKAAEYLGKIFEKILGAFPYIFVWIASRKFKTAKDTDAALKRSEGRAKVDADMRRASDADLDKWL